MSKKMAASMAFITIVAFIAGFLVAQEDNTIHSAVISLNKAQNQKNDWGVFYTYFCGETYGTKDVLTGVAVIKPGMQIHPPHIHAEEEYLMVTEGTGSWHLNGKDFPAQKGDILYAAPWDIHGITNSSNEPLEVVVLKWNNKGMKLPVQKY